MSIFMSIDLEKPNDWRDGASNLEQWSSWDRAQRRKRGILAGLVFWSKTNVPRSRVLLSRHWPHRLCWDWALWVSMHRPGYDGARSLSLVVTRKYRSVSLNLVFVRFRLSWQNSQWMVASGPLRETAPKILWVHHLAAAEPAGHA